MNFEQFKSVLFMGCLFLMAISCNKDDSLVSDSSADFTENYEDSQGRRPNPRGDGNVPRMGRTDVTLDWIDLFLDLDRYATGMRPCATARALAYIHLAAYETGLPGMPQYRTNVGKLPALTAGPDLPGAPIDLSLSLNQCYATTIKHFLNTIPTSLAGQITELESTFKEARSREVDPAVVQSSMQWGDAVAEWIIGYAQTDAEGEQQILSAQPHSYEPPTGAGFWTYSAEPERALFPYWGNVRAFVVKPDQTSSVPPIPYSDQPGSEYHQQMLDVYQANNEARAEDGEDLWIAEFWSDDVENMTFGPPSRQLSIAGQLIRQKHLPLDQSLYLLLKLGLSLNDAAVATWKYKYEYMVMRPSVYIQSFIDPSYQTNLYRLIPWPNPTFPGYPSGHSCFASAAAGIFIEMMGNRIDFTDRSHEGRSEFRGAPRAFKSFEEMAIENAFSRIPLGVHIKMDCDEGLRLGYEISDLVNQYDLRMRPRA